ncbi:MAG: alpha/beta hydrolase [Phycisphaerae bacterium]|nr:alpha/beta hydrolase [Phycisphaerae bacterium]
MPIRWLAAVAGCVLSNLAVAGEPRPRIASDDLAPRIVLDPAVQSGPFSGRVYLALTPAGQVEPRRRMHDWFRPAIIFSKDVVGLEPGEELSIDDGWLGFPGRWSSVPEGEYAAQAVVRRSLDSPSAGQGENDLISEPVAVRIPFEPGDRDEGIVRATERVSAPPFRETDRVRLVEIVSSSLSAFHGREYKVRAGVLLPEGHVSDGSVRYPVVYSITGFGGDHRAAHGIQRMVPPEAAAHVIMVVPDASCYRGHSVLADSENNGPWGRMFIDELIPEVESRFHGAGEAQRYVTGVSSGGWSSLWLQVTYPDRFAGCWSHCPDPVDFRDFQRINIYEQPANMYRDEAGERRPLARRGDRVLLWYEDFCRREWVLGPGGQIHSFEAVFSPRSADGEPALLFDRTTGEVDLAVARAWEGYDIRLVLERDWARIGPSLSGKIHVYAGGADTFYLEGSVELLKKTLEDLGSSAVVEIIPGMGHTLHGPGNAAMFQAILDRAAGSPSKSDASGG